MRSVFTCLACVAGLATSTASAKPPPQHVDMANAVQVRPLRIASVTRENGALVYGPWTDLGDFSSRLPSFCGWDSYGRDWGPNSNATPIYGDFCGLSPGTRWYFGSGYHAPMMVDDMLDIAQPGAIIDEFDFAWTWESTGSCDLVVEFTNDFNDHCLGWNGFPYYGGFVLSFGPLAGSSGTIYVTSAAGLSTLNIPLPNNPLGPGSGSYRVTITDGAGNLAPGPTQPMLWGPKENFPVPLNTAPYIEGCGLSYGNILVDDNPTDGNLDTLSECYDYTFGACPDPLNVMAAFGLASPPCPPCPTVTVTKTYIVTGTPNGTPWTWGLAETPLGFPLSAHGSNPGVSSSLTVCDLRNALVADINAVSAANLCPVNALTATPGLCVTLGGVGQAVFTLTATVCVGSDFDLYVGNGTYPPNPPTTLVPLWPSFAVFNPKISEIILSGADCNSNDRDDAIDIAIGSSADANANGIPDECECLADFNHDGFLTGDDFDLYVNAFELGVDAADFNADGFVTGDDFDLYVAAFELGC